MAFPFRFGKKGITLADRKAHVKGQIAQVLFTIAGERVHRPDFGAGVKALLFEPNTSALSQLTRKRLLASLASALSGEVDPKSIEVSVKEEEAMLFIRVAYTLGTISHRETHTFTLDRLV